MSKHRKPPLAVARAAAILALGIGLAPAATLHAQAQPLPVEAPSSSASQTPAFDIPEQSLSRALAEFARQSGLELLYTPEVVEGLTASAVSGQHTREAAMRLLLQGTELDFIVSASGGMVIGDRATLEAHRARMRGNGGASAASPDSGGSLAETAPVDPALLDPGVNLTGESTTSSVETTRRGGIEEIIVTGQKRAERIQDVPIAISAFSMKDLDDQKIEGGFDLLKGVPNVTFSKTNFSGYNFQIRGIGTQAVSATTDPGVAVSFNNTTLIVNRLFEQEYLDIERVEVLRGPQGTLYGRNATAGVINVISAKPELGVSEGEIKLETGNYGAQRIRGYYNLPIGEDFALRAAYGSTVRDGYGYNQYDGSDIDDRDLWTGRLTLGWEPNERTRVNLLYERFEEDDQRVRSVKQLCHRDEGPTSIGSLDFSTLTNRLTGGNGEEAGVILQDALSQGCLPGSLYADGAFSAPNGYAIPFLMATRTPGQSGGVGDNPYYAQSGAPVISPAPCELLEFAQYVSLINPCAGDPYRGLTQSRDMRSIYSVIKPTYQAESDVFELSVDFDVTDELVLSSQTVYVEDSVLSTQDFNRFETQENFFSDSSIACPTTTSGGVFGCTPQNGGVGASFFADVTPGGIFCDPQLGCSDRFLFMDMSRANGSQFNQEVRLVSSFKSDVNFSIGANFTRFETTNDYFVMSNGISMLARTPPFVGDIRVPGGRLCRPPGSGIGFASCLYTDPQSLDELARDNNPEGHNYFLSRNPYELTSAAFFGETYWQATDALKFTGGLRVTWDRKAFTPVPSQTLLIGYQQFLNGVGEYEDPSQCTTNNVLRFCSVAGSTPDGRGYIAEPEIVQSWLEPTGRIGFDLKLDTGFTDETMVYGFLTRGYKAGGANPPGIAAPQGAFIAAAQGAVSPKVFKAEYVNALELGAKNTLLDGAMTLNVSGFYYDYSDYQISKIVDRSAANENFDATVWGLELEAAFAPTPDTLFNAAIGYLNTRVADGEQSIDLMDRTQGGEYFHITTIQNPRFDPNTTPRDRQNYVAGLNAPTDQQFLAFDEWFIVKPAVTQSSNCVAPVELAALAGANHPASPADAMASFCPGGPLLGANYASTIVWGTPAFYPGSGGILYNPALDAPNGSAGMHADLSGHELPNAPHFTVSLGGQQTVYLPGGWDLTGRLDWYWQDKSFHRIYNTEYDRLKAWTNTNLSFWVNKAAWDLKVEVYVKNLFDETPITGAFLNSDDTALTTNVFTLDPRLFGVSITKRF